MLFFSKKFFLTDHLEGLVDIHNHILPDIDDGSSDLETSIEMIRLYKELGFKSCIATPHTMEDYYGNDVITIEKCFNDFKQNETDFVIKASSEYMMDGNFENLIESENILFLKERIILTEFSYFQKPHYVEEALFNMLQKDITPILAHPERYKFINELEEFEDLKNRGFQFQLNFLSLDGHYGKDAQKKAFLLLDNAMYDYGATDAHKPDHLRKLKEIRIPKKVSDQLKSVISNTLTIFN